MKIEFVMRNPGNHTVLPIMEVDAIPRVGEGVVFDKDGPYHEVHSVTHFPGRGVVSVLLRV